MRVNRAFYFIEVTCSVHTKSTGRFLSPTKMWTLSLYRFIGWLLCFFFLANWCTPLVLCLLFIFVSIIYFRQTLVVVARFLLCSAFYTAFILLEQQPLMSNFLCVNQSGSASPSYSNRSEMNWMSQSFVSRLATSDFSLITFPRNFALSSSRM